jgi:hypothetical protein
MDEYKLLQSLEQELVDPLTRKNSDRLHELISDDFEEFGSSGRSYRKSEVITLLANEETVNYKLGNFSFKTLSNDCILVKYKSQLNNVTALRSSIWIKSKGNWQMLHHQATDVPSAF